MNSLINSTFGTILPGEEFFILVDAALLFRYTKLYYNKARNEDDQGKVYHFNNSQVIYLKQKQVDN